MYTKTDWLTGWLAGSTTIRSTAIWRKMGPTCCTTTKAAVSVITPLLFIILLTYYRHTCNAAVCIVCRHVLWLSINCLPLLELVYVLWLMSTAGHIQGEACEWVACNDVMLSVLSGGTGNQSVVGLYAASAHPVVVPAKLTPNGTTILVFQAYGTTSVSFAAGSATNTELTLTAMTDAKITLSGGFLMLKSQQVEVLTYNVSSVGQRRDPKLVSQHPAFAVGGVSGQQQLQISLSIYQTVVLRKT